MEDLRRQEASLAKAGKVDIVAWRSLETGEIVDTWLTLPPLPGSTISLEEYDKGHAEDLSKLFGELVECMGKLSDVQLQKLESGEL